jgi:hypothetical protein
MMIETICESCGIGVEPKIDRKAGVIHGVKIIGNHSRNGRHYPNSVLADAVGLYEGAKVNLDHTEGAAKPRRYSERFGLIQNVALKEDDGLYADFLFNANHPLAGQFLWDAEHSPGNVGFSHHVEAQIRRNGNDVLVEKITAVRSVDLVADPATTSGLFEGIAAVQVPPLTEARVLELIEEQLRISQVPVICKERQQFGETFDLREFAAGLKQS